MNCLAIIIVLVLVVVVYLWSTGTSIGAEDFVDMSDYNIQRLHGTFADIPAAYKHTPSRSITSLDDAKSYLVQTKDCVAFDSNFMFMRAMPSPIPTGTVGWTYVKSASIAKSDGFVTIVGGTEVIHKGVLVNNAQAVFNSGNSKYVAFDGTYLYTELSTVAEQRAPHNVTYTVKKSYVPTRAMVPVYGVRLSSTTSKKMSLLECASNPDCFGWQDGNTFAADPIFAKLGDVAADPNAVLMVPARPRGKHVKTTGGASYRARTTHMSAPTEASRDHISKTKHSIVAIPGASDEELLSATLDSCRANNSNAACSALVMCANGVGYVPPDNYMTLSAARANKNGVDWAPVDNPSDSCTLYINSDMSQYDASITM